MSIYLRNFLRFLLLLLIQALLLNKLSQSWWASPGELPSFIPFIYPLFILLLPVATPTWFMLVAGFITGVTADAFMDTGGMHAVTCVLIAFVRLPLLTMLLPRRIADYGLATPSPKTLGGWTPFLTYTIVLLLIHHIAYFIIEIWSFRSIGYLLLKILITLVTSVIFVILYTLLFSKSLAKNE